MDPKENLRKQRDLARKILGWCDTLRAMRANDGTEVGEGGIDTLACELAEHVLALDAWMLRGGTSPYATDWSGA